MVARELVRLLPEGSERKRFQAAYVETRRNDERIVVALPETFMNDSGLAVAQLARWYRVPPQRILVIYDEMDLPFGTLRLRDSGSDGNHNGMTSIIQHLGTQAFPRLRVGIGRPRSGSTVPYVLSRFTATEQQSVPLVMRTAAEAAVAWLDEGITSAMNQFNRSVQPVPAARAPAAQASSERDALSRDV
jgi:PTH1 family peptidyl-tRNA hydrolase